MIYQQFSVSYTAKIMDNIKTRAENRCNSIDLLRNERIAQLFSLAHTQTSGTIIYEDPTAEPDISISTPVRELGRNLLKRDHTKGPKV